MSLTSIQKEIVHLSSAERAMLIDILWESLDEARVKEIEAKWAAESEERIEAVDRGELQTCGYGLTSRSCELEGSDLTMCSSAPRITKKV